MKRFIKNIVAKNLPFTLIFAIAAFLRLFRVEEFITFLSDQGRDALIIKDIVTFKHFPLIGAPTSIGQVFLGPAYYYFVAPFLLIYNFNPAGLAYGVAFYMLIGIIACYVLIKREVDVQVALLFSLITAFSAVNITLSRFSWNPNLLPLSSFFALFSLYKLMKDRSVIAGVFFGFFLGLSFQFHYLALFLLPSIGIVYLFFLYKHKVFKSFRTLFFVPLLSFIVTISPLVFFDLRHGFINSKNFITLFSIQKDVPHELFSTKFLNVNSAFYSLFFNIPVSISLALLISLLVLIVYLLISKRKKVSLLIHINFLTFFLFIISFSLVQTPRHIHYFTPIYFSFTLVLAYFLAQIASMKGKWIVIVSLILVLFIYQNVYTLPFFSPAGNGQIKHAQTVAEFMLPKIGDKPFNIAVWPVYFSEDNYVYFLSLAGHTPADRAKVEVTDQMFVLCNEEPCLVLNSPSWNISMFGRAEIDKIWIVEGIKIYKLVHAK
ncbi:hypothetical protein A3D80_00990 [Candidatus Roizmanbacteria bacterium RIFCSPHIGHO2_02_FULL_40_13b]|uniref:Glycosyltransferase RgtA/B/C/D-like domain-containing protein n=1 Tax=Candidatus Roizmanbacteria bacterium RIFCSPHIGHO2_01_FULL_39_24 TaxID=1802032 RepID=A0A1F7GJY6_9BACT|nr:MAG: hypothetical protein A2799_02355 [Candidatus Roizmanbacteria bacterium RIFCSPHIGHO2_01_FULL_39_24]OGK26271.1 MAG: hypothetical protein A3D80_00990 [Candidatus Roizmanbacteria bacterium RIFCSPHIGHO2_02_FULL_40_13b]OGK48906.1 MAG: hypothetical protein A3A56_01750 [Candidatus Roizmanbacteria bacterium RIFCSPLOWO2_01_FULL_40_32]